MKTVSNEEKFMTMCREKYTAKSLNNFLSKKNVMKDIKLFIEGLKMAILGKDDEKVMLLFDVIKKMYYSRIIPDHMFPIFNYSYYSNKPNYMQKLFNDYDEIFDELDFSIFYGRAVFTQDPSNIRHECSQYVKQYVFNKYGCRLICSNCILFVKCSVKCDKIINNRFILKER